MTVPLVFNNYNIVGIVIGICDGFLLGFSLGKKIENQEGLLDGDSVGLFVIFPCGI